MFGFRSRALRRLAHLSLLMSVVPVATATGDVAEAAGPMAVSGTVTGFVWNDTNGDGLKGDSAIEPGIAGVGVVAYDATGAVVSAPNPTLTGSDGTYSLTITNSSTDDVRIEFATPTGYEPAPSPGGQSWVDNGTSIQFAKVNETDVDFALLIPDNFCGDNQSDTLLSGTVVATCFYPGARNWAPGESTWDPGLPPGTPDRGTVKFTRWNDSNGNVGAANTLAANPDTGALWGLGYQRPTGLLFASAVVRRHADLGPQGVGGLYVMRNGQNGVVTSWDLASLYSGQGVLFTAPGSDWSRAARGIVDVTADPTTIDPSTGLSTDIIGWNNVGKAGIGDIDVSPDGQYLWVVNLYERTLLRIALNGDRAAPSLGTLTEFAIPTNVCSLAGSEERPWAVDPRADGTVRVGLVCDNAGAQDTDTEFSLDNKSEGAFVYQLTPGTSTWAQLLQVPLAARARFDFICGTSFDGQVGNPNPADGTCWQSWLSGWDTYITGATPRGLLQLLPQATDGFATFQYGQPMLMDIENLRDGSLVLGFSDRTSMQFGSNNIQPTTGTQLPTENAGKEGYDPTNTYMTSWVMGETILACKQAGGSWAVESSGSCSGVNEYSGVPLGDDPTPYGEFWQDALEGTPHLETRTGGLATMPGVSGPDVLGAATMDPCDIFSGGVVWNVIATGAKSGACATYTGLGNEAASAAGFGKSTSMGDLETICDAAPIEIGNRIWVDLDADGIQDPGEPPIAGVTVNLYNANGDLVGTAITDEFGEYYFNSLVDDDFDTGDNVGAGPNPFEAYTLKIDNPDDWAPGGVLDSAISTLTTANQSAPNGSQSDAVDSDYTLADGYPTLAVAARLPGESDHTFDAGIIQQQVTKVGVGDYTWIDSDKDGIQDVDEPVLPDVLVELLNPDGTQATDADGNLVDGVYTDANGFYFFDNLLPGTYKMRFTLPEGYTFTTPSSTGSTSANDSNPEPTVADPLVGVTPEFTIADSAVDDTVADTNDDYIADFFNPTIDAGVNPPVYAVGDYTWFDTDRDGVQDEGELPAPGVGVALYDANGDPAVDADGNLVPPQTTDANGFYLFDNLASGTYQIRFTPPSGYELTGSFSASGTDADDSNADSLGWSDQFTLDPSNANLELDTDPATDASFVDPTIDAGFVTPTVGVGNYTWIDTDKDGIQDAGELALPDVMVELLDAAGNPVNDAYGNPVSAVYTDENGFYFFDDLSPGTYKIRFTLPDGYTFTTQSSGGSTSANDSNPAPTVGDPLVGVTPNFTLTADTAGDMEADTADDYGAAFINPTIDAGVNPPLYAVGDYTWFDTDRDGVQDAGELPAPGVGVALYDASGDPAVDADGNPVPAQTTDANGFYLFDNLLPGTYQIRFTPPAGYVPTVDFSATGTDVDDSNADGLGWSDQFTLGPSNANLELDTDPATAASFVDPTIDAGFVTPTVGVGNYTWIDTDKDGIQDVSEASLEGVMVELLDAAGNPVTDAFGNPVGAVYTDENGYYFFDDLLPGTYKVRFTLPDGYRFTATSSAGATPANDSNPIPTVDDQSVGVTPTFTLTAAAGGSMVADTEDEYGASFINPTIDAGVVPPVFAVGNYTWVDVDRDGTQDAAEPPIAGVFVELFDENGDPVLDADGEPVPGVYTDANGFYLFDNLLPGTYTMKFTLPTGLAFTDTMASGPDGNDSNAYADGFTDPFTIAPGAANTVLDNDPDTAATFINPTIDAGVYSTIPVVGVGDYTWFDLDRDGIQGADELPAEGVKVELLNPDGTPATDAFGRLVPPVFTDENGYYFFDGLASGDYKMRFTVPEGYEFTEPSSAGSSSDDDSNPVVTADPLVAVTPTFSLTDSGAGDMERYNGDAYMAEFINPTIDAGVVPPTVAVGNFTWIDLDRDGVQDVTEPVLPGVYVELFDADGNPVLDAAGDPVMGVYTDETGHYLFDNLLPGTYTMRFTLPDGYRFTDTYGTDNEGLDSNAWSDGFTDPFTVVPGDGNTVVDNDPDTVADFVNPTIDAGVVPLVAVGNYVWYDLDADGVQDATEEPIVGCAVQLLNPDGTPALDADGNPVPTLYTDADGRYLFDNLLPGDYRVQFTLPDDVHYAFTLSGGDTSSEVGSNPNRYTGITPVFTVNPAVLGDTVADDDPATAAVLVNPTIDAGVVPVVAVSNYFWFDADYDGVRDPEETPVVGGTVLLLNPDGTPALDAEGNPVPAASTDTDGFFLFDNLVPGDYRLQFIPPDGYAFTVPGSDDTDEADSNVNPDGITEVFSVLAQPLGSTSTDVDGDTNALLANPTVGAGLVVLVAVGNRTWIDTDGDGVQDAGEPPVAGVRVELLNPDGTPATDALGNPVAPVRTDSLGRYLFDNLLPGDYRIRFTAPAGMRLTAQGVGSGSTDSNPDQATGVTPVFTIGFVAGGFTVVDSSAATVARLVNPTIDAGFVQAVLPATGSNTHDLGLIALLCVLLGAALAMVAVRRGTPVLAVNISTPLGPDGGGTRPAGRRAITVAGLMSGWVGREVSRSVGRRRRR